jgi:sulfofructose kinase
VKAIDTIGAGDNFHATFALAIARGMSLHQSVKLSVASASMSCREYGGRNGIPSWNEAKTAASHLTAEVIQ